jgi:hypothetical protein
MNLKLIDTTQEDKSMNVRPSKENRCYFLAIMLIAIAPTVRAQDVADRIDLAGLLVEDGTQSQIRKMIGDRLRGITNYDLVIIAHHQIDDAVCFGVRRTEKGVRKIDGPDRKGATEYRFEYCYFELEKAEDFSVKETTIEAAKGLLSEAWELVENPKNGIQRANLNRMTALHEEVYFYVYCRDPDDPTHHFVGGVIINPVKGTKSELFAKKITELFSR